MQEHQNTKESVTISILIVTMFLSRLFVFLCLFVFASILIIPKDHFTYISPTFTNALLSSPIFNLYQMQHIKHSIHYLLFQILYHKIREYKLIPKITKYHPETSSFTDPLEYTKNAYRNRKYKARGLLLLTICHAKAMNIYKALARQW